MIQVCTLDQMTLTLMGWLDKKVGVSSISIKVGTSSVGSQEHGVRH